MPEIIPFIGKGVAMPCAPRKTTRFITERIMRLLYKGAKRFIADGHPIGIAREFRTRCSILQVIFSLVFIYKSTFHKGIQKSIVHVFTETMPAPFVRFQIQQLFSFSDRLKCFAVYFDTIKRIEITASIIAIEFTIII